MSLPGCPPAPECGWESASAVASSVFITYGSFATDVNTFFLWEKEVPASWKKPSEGRQAQVREVPSGVLVPAPPPWLPCLPRPRPLCQAPRRRPHTGMEYTCLLRSRPLLCGSRLCVPPEEESGLPGVEEPPVHLQVCPLESCLVQGGAGPVPAPHLHP